MNSNQLTFILAAVDQATAVLKNVEGHLRSLDTTAQQAGKGGLQSFNQQTLAINSTLTALVGGAAFQRFISFIGESARESNQATVDMALFERQLERNNIAVSNGTSVLESLASRLRVLPETLSGNVTQLLRQGLTMEEISGLYTNAAASALAAGQTTAKGVEAATQAIVNQNSIYLNQIGVAENVVSFLQSEAKARGVMREELTKEQAARAIVNGIMNVTKEEAQDLDRLLGGLTGSQSDLSNATAQLRMELGEAFLPVVQAVTVALTGAINVFRSLPEPVQVGVTVLVGLTAAAVAITGVIGTLTIAVSGLGISLAAVFGPAAIVAAGIALLIALKQEAYDSAEALKQLKTDGENAAIAMDTVSDATGKDGVVQALKDFRSTMTSDGVTAFDDYIKSSGMAIESAANFQEAQANSVKAILDFQLARTSAALLEAAERKKYLELLDDPNSLTPLQRFSPLAGVGTRTEAEQREYEELGRTIETLTSQAAGLGDQLGKWYEGTLDTAAATRVLRAETAGIPDLPFLFEQTGDSANNAADGVGNLGSSAGKATEKVRTVTDVLGEYQTKLGLITREENERGKAFDAVAAQLQLEQSVYKELLELNAPSELTQQFAASIAKLQAILEPVKNVRGEVQDFSSDLLNLNALSRASSEIQAQQAASFQVWLQALESRADILNQLASATERANEETAKTEAAQVAALAVNDYSTSLSKLNAMSEVALYLQARQQAAWQVELQALERRRDILNQLASATERANEETAKAEATKVATAAVGDYTTSLDALNRMALTRLGLQDKEAAAWQQQLRAIESQIDITNQLASATERANKASEDAANRKSAQKEVYDFSSSLTGLNNMSKTRADVEAAERPAKQLEQTLKDIITVSRAVGDAFGGDFGRAADAIAQTAEVALNAVQAIASGNPIAIATAAIQVIGFIASEIAEATKNHIAEAAAAIDKQYELIGKAGSEALANAHKKLEWRWFLFIPYQVEVPDEPALQAATKIYNTFAQGLYDGLPGSQEEFAKWLDKWIDQLTLQAIVAAQNLQPITEAIQKALEDGVIDATERANIQGMANAVRNNILQAATAAGIDFGDSSPSNPNSLEAWRKELNRLKDELEKADVGSELFRQLQGQITALEKQIEDATRKAGEGIANPPPVKAEVSFGSQPLAIQYAVATPLVEASQMQLDAARMHLEANTMLIDFLKNQSPMSLAKFDTSVLLFDSATIRFTQAVDRFERHSYSMTEVMR